MKLVYFDITAELILDILKEKTDLPNDSKAIRVESDPTWDDGKIHPGNVLRFYVQSDEFQDILEGSLIPQITPTCKING